MFNLHIIIIYLNVLAVDIRLWFQTLLDIVNVSVKE
jgi:hypothetical protein